MRRIKTTHHGSSDPQFTCQWVIFQIRAVQAARIERWKLRGSKMKGQKPRGTSQGYREAAKQSAYRPTRHFQMQSRPVSGLAGLDVSPSHELEDSQWLGDVLLEDIRYTHTCLPLRGQPRHVKEPPKRPFNRVLPNLVPV